MIKVRAASKKLEIKVNVVRRDEKGKEVTEYDEAYEPVVSAIANFIGMLLTCGDSVEGAMKDLDTIATKLMTQTVPEGR